MANFGYMIVDINKIKSNPKNPRIIKDDKFKKLVKSITDFPQMLDKRPLVCFTDTDGKFVVLGGNMRLKAAKEVGLKELPVLLADDWTEEQKSEFLIKDNVGFGEWDWDELANDWDAEQLTDWGLDIPDFKVENEVVEDDFDGVPPKEPITVLGDLYELNEHRLHCADSCDSDAVAKLMNGVYPDLIHTDPPYGMNAVSKSGVLKERYGSDIIGDDNTDIAKDAFRLIYSLYPDAKQIWWGANYYCSVLPDSECWLVWDKNNGGSDQTDCELAWANFRSVVRQFTQSSEKHNRVHPTQKPVSLVKWIMERFNLSSKTIADYFGGSGVTMIAADQMGKQCFTMEFGPNWCDVIVARYIKHRKETGGSLVIKRNGVQLTGGEINEFIENTESKQ